MNNLDDTGEITPQQQGQEIDKLIAQRAASKPPRWMTATTITFGILAVADVPAFTIHTVARRNHSSIGVHLGIHATVFAVLWLVAVTFLVGLVCLQAAIARAAEQDKIATYRHRRTIGAIRDALAAQPDIIREAVKDVLAERDREARLEQWMGQADHERTAHGLHAVDGTLGDGVVRHLPPARPNRRSG